MFKEPGKYQLDLGDGRHYADFYVLENLGQAAGLILYHRQPAKPDEWCAQAYAWHRSPDDPRPVWELVSRDPLTLKPSLHCLDCGDHGFIREGRWIAAPGG